MTRTLPWFSAQTARVTLKTLRGLALSLTIVALSIPTPSFAEDLKFHIDRAIVFKDGYALLVKRATGTTDESGRLFSNEVPDEAVLGSLWVDVSPVAEGAAPLRLQSLTAKQESTETVAATRRTCRSLAELLQANVGRHVTISTSRGDMDGELVELIGHETEESLPISSSLSSSSTTMLSLTAQTRNAQHLILRSGGRDTLVAIGDVQRVHATELQTRLTVEETTKRSGKRWVLQTDQPNTEVEIKLVYFRSGIRWIPTYRIELGADPNSAVVSMQAELLNEAESLEQTEIDLVVGVPNFRFRDTPSPLTMEAAMRMTLQQAAPLLMNNYLSNSASQAMFSQRAGEFDREVRQPDAAIPTIPSELDGAGTQDLFVIHLNKLDLGKGERAAVPVTTATVPCRHVYTWKVSLVRNDVELAPTQSGAGSPLALSENEVWHQLELTNNTDAPWTTGAAMMLDQGQPLAQELLTYTSSGSKVRVPITVAVDLRGSFDEREINRTLGALHWDGWDYAKIEKQGLIELINRKSTAVDFEIECHVPGKVDRATGDGDLEVHDFLASDWQNYRGSGAVNHHSIIRWKRTLEAGETFEATIDSHYFARQ